MAKGVPTARSQRYKATHQAQEPIHSIPPKGKIPTTNFICGNDVLPSLPLNPITQAEGAQRAFTTVDVLLRSLLQIASPDTHQHALLQLITAYFSDCSQWHRESEDRNLVLQQQLDDSNAKLPQIEVQNAEILKLEDQLKKSQTVSDFYREQAMKAGVVPSPRRNRTVSSDDDNFTPEQLSQQLSLALTDIQVRDFALEQLQLQNTELKRSLDQVLNSSSETLALHVALFDQHVHLLARLNVSNSAVKHYRTQFLESRTTADHVSAQLHEVQPKYDKLVAQVSNEDSLFKAMVASKVHGDVFMYYSGYRTTVRKTYTDDLRRLRPHLWPASHADSDSDDT
jgi:hypothetical protein